MTVLETLFRTLLGFFTLLVLTRVIGKKQLSQMNFFTYITGIALGNIAGDMVVHKDVKLIDGVTGLILWVVLVLGIDQLSLKVPKARVILDGEPTIVIKKGEIVEKAMTSNKLNMDDLSMLLRTKNVFSIQEVDYAILEPNGKLSVLKKQEAENVTKKDLQIQPTPRLYMPAELIVDGQVITKNLKELGLSQDWLENQIQVSGVQSVKEVFYAELQSDGSVHVNKKSEETQSYLH